MSVIVTDSGFAPDDWEGAYAPIDALPAPALDLASDTPIEALQDLTPFLPEIAMIRVGFPHFADGRGFTLARQLRLLGYQGRLRAHGHVIADQYAMARRAGFDEVQIDAALAKRQPQDQWLYRSNWQAHDHQSRLRG